MNSINNETIPEYINKKYFFYKDKFNIVNKIVVLDTIDEEVINIL